MPHEKKSSGIKGSPAAAAGGNGAPGQSGGQGQSGFGQSQGQGGEHSGGQGQGGSGSQGGGQGHKMHHTILAASIEKILKVKNKNPVIRKKLIELKKLNARLKALVK